MVWVLSTAPPSTWTLYPDGEKDRIPPGDPRGTAVGSEPAGRPRFTLQVGAVTQTVEVVGSAPLLESSTSSVGQVIESRRSAIFR